MDPALRAATLRVDGLPAARWRPAIDALAALGFGAVEVPLIWREHSGRVGSDGLDLRGLLRETRAAGLSAVVSLGPFNTDDVPGLGVPEALLRDPSVCARTRRGNPVVVRDGLRATYLPSTASGAWRAAVERWIAEAIDALRPALDDGTVTRVVVGPERPPARLQSVDDADHHPAAPPAEDPAEAACARATAMELDWLRWLADRVESAGVDPGRVTVAVAGAFERSPTMAELSRERPVAVQAPTPRVGSIAAWRALRLASALPRGALVSLPAGGAPTDPPARSGHAREVARVALAAGVRCFAVRTGCSGHGWVGALLDERGRPRPHAARWAELLRWADALPHGDERARTTAFDRASLEAARARSPEALPWDALDRIGFAMEHFAGGLGVEGVDDWDDRVAVLAGHAPAWLRAPVDAPRPVAQGGPVLARCVDTGASLAWVVLNPNASEVTLPPLGDGPPQALAPGGVAVIDGEGGAR